MIRLLKSAALVIFVSALAVATAAAQVDPHSTGDSPPPSVNTSRPGDLSWLWWLLGSIITSAFVGELPRLNLSNSQPSRRQFDAQGNTTPQWLTRQRQQTEIRQTKEQNLPPGYHPPRYYQRSSDPLAEQRVFTHHEEKRAALIWPAIVAALILTVALYAYISASSRYGYWYVPDASALTITADLAWLIYGIVQFVRGTGHSSGQVCGRLIIIVSAIVTPYLLYLAGLLTIVNQITH